VNSRSLLRALERKDAQGIHGRELIMRIVILTAGSRGDVQPFVALGRGLKTAGHEVTLVTAGTFEKFVKDNDLQFGYLNDDLLKLKDTSEGRQALEGGGNKLALIKKVKPMLREMLSDAWKASQQAEVIIYHPKALGGYHIAEKLNIPAFMSIPLPIYTPTAAFPLPILPPNIRLGGWFNHQSYSLLKLVSAPYVGIINEWREQTLGLPHRKYDELVRADGSPIPVLYSYSSHVIPRPADWPDWVTTTGYWFLDDQTNWQPPADLVRFIESGTPPIYIGFGSMAGSDPAAKAKVVLEALAQSKQRGVIAIGWGGLEITQLPENVYVLDEAPHEWLFPRMGAVVHHGGAGTTAAGLRAGKPTVICPFIGDQPFWGQRVYELGVGTKPIPQKKLTVEKLAAAICTALTDNGMHQRAEALSLKLRTEDGIGSAVDIINSTISH
jgi:sterol 3beta-glucosyltransferase